MKRRIAKRMMVAALAGLLAVAAAPVKAQAKKAAETPEISAWEGTDSRQDRTELQMADDDTIVTGRLGKKGGVVFTYDKTNYTLTLSGEDEFEFYDPNNDGAVADGEFGFLADRVRTAYRISFDKIVFSNCKIKGSMNRFFSNLGVREIDLSGLDSSEVVNMNHMFGDMYNENLKLTGLDKLNTSKVTDMGWMFANGTFLREVDLSGFDTSAATNMYGMLTSCSKLESVTGLKIVSKETGVKKDLEMMFAYCYNLTSVDTSGWDMSKVENTEHMFQYCYALTSLDVSKWDLSSVNWMGEMFDDCYNLAELDVSRWNTSHIMNMDYMFRGCRSLKKLDVSKWDTSNFMHINNMFEGCSALSQLDVSGWDTSRVYKMDGIFKGCSSLKKLDLSGFCMKTLGDKKENASWYPANGTLEEMFSGCSALAQLKTPKNMGNITMKLPTTYYDEGGKAYTKITSANAGQTLTLTKPVIKTYKIIYVLNGGVNDSKNPASGSSDKEITLKNPTRKGCYKFAGWYQESNFKTKMTAIPKGNTKDVKLYAKWEEKHNYKNQVTKATLTKNGKITPVCSVCKAVGKAKVISRPKSFKLSAAKLVYNGKAKKPGIKIKDAAGKVIAASHYKLTYDKGCKDVGKYTVKVTFKGNYQGTKNLSFEIVPAPVKITTITPGSKKLTIKWNKNTKQVTGYEVQYSTNKDFPKSAVKTVTIKKNSTTGSTVTKLKAKQKYYVRIRTYKKVAKKNYYSAWSEVKTAVTKK